MPLSHPYEIKDKTILLKARVSIDFTKPLPFYNQGPLKAYAAITMHKKTDAFALVCDRSLLPRIQASYTYSHMKAPYLMQLLERGVIYDPIHKQERYAFVYVREENLSRFSDSDEGVALNMSTRTVIDRIIPNLLDALRFFHKREIAHGSIRLSNIFVNQDDDFYSRFMLGDCLSLPYAHSQPVLYQTLAMSLCSPEGRGQGHISDDVYAAGVCLALILRRKDPLQNLDDKEIIRRKLRDGSYTTLMGDDRLSGPLFSLVRGMLHDDPKQRAKLDDLKNWEKTQQYTSKQNIRPKNALRPIHFNGKDYSRSDMLALDLVSNIEETVYLVENNSLEQWLERAVSDKIIQEQFERGMILAHKNKKSSDYSDRLVASTMVSLNSDLPLFYKGRIFIPDGHGFGGILTPALTAGETLNDLVDLIKNGAITNWLSVQFESQLEIQKLISLFELAKTYIKNPRIGYGLERCLYLLHPYTHCLSPVFKNHCVYDSKDFLCTLDRLLEKDIKTPLYDRHMVAFLAEHDARIMQVRLFDLNNELHHNAEIALLKCYGEIQKRHKLGPLQSLAKAFTPYFNSICKIYHNREIRKKIRSDLESFAKKGDLTAMAHILEGSDRLTHDRALFQQARHEYYNLEQEALTIRMQVRGQGTQHNLKAKESASYILGFLAMALSVMIIIGYLGGHINF